MNLNAQELRIGNLFQEKKTKEIIMATELSITEIWFSGSFEQYWQAEPIPLTEEWLIKFGFTNYENESWFWSFDFNDKQETFKVFALTAGGVPMGLWGVVGCPQLVKKIEFVNQLQNLYFSLTGEELTLKN